MLSDYHGECIVANARQQHQNRLQLLQYECHIFYPSHFGVIARSLPLCHNYVRFSMIGINNTFIKDKNNNICRELKCLKEQRRLAFKEYLCIYHEARTLSRLVQWFISRLLTSGREQLLLQPELRVSVPDQNRGRGQA